jgi:hypothetical protein
MAPAQRTQPKEMVATHEREVQQLHTLMDPTLEKFFDIGNKHFKVAQKPI